MIIICNEKEADKKVFKKIQKIVISEDLKDVRGKTITQCYYLLPPSDLQDSFYDNDISLKSYKNKYQKYLRREDEIYANLIVLMMMYNKYQDILLVCSTREMEYLYIDFLSSVLEDDFGIEYCTYKKWKKKEEFGNCAISIKSLKKAVKEYRHILEDDEYKESKKKKKKKKSEKKHRLSTKDLDKSKKHKKETKILSSAGLRKTIIISKMSKNL